MDSGFAIVFSMNLLDGSEPLPFGAIDGPPKKPGGDEPIPMIELGVGAKLGNGFAKVVTEVCDGIFHGGIEAIDSRTSSITTIGERSNASSSSTMGGRLGVEG